MKTINLDTQTHTFSLWEDVYKYTQTEEDRQYFIHCLISLDVKKDNTDALMQVFSRILSRDNDHTTIEKEDVAGLFYFFCSLFLKK